MLVVEPDGLTAPVHEWCAAAPHYPAGMRIGLTGGIASGKSAVAELLAAYGALVIDADVLAREVVAPGTLGLQAVLDRFGVGVLSEPGVLNRAALGAVVFADHAARRDLEAIVHPAVRRRAAEIERQAGPGVMVVHVIPLLVETHQAGDFDLVVVVDVDAETQLRRLMSRTGLSDADARARVSAQASREARIAAADVVIDNNGPREALAGQVRDLWARASSDGPRPAS